MIVFRGWPESINSVSDEWTMSQKALWNRGINSSLQWKLRLDKSIWCLYVLYTPILHYMANNPTGRYSCDHSDSPQAVNGDVVHKGFIYTRLMDFRYFCYIVTQLSFGSPFKIADFLEMNLYYISNHYTNKTAGTSWDNLELQIIVCCKYWKYQWL